MRPTFKLGDSGDIVREVERKEGGEMLWRNFRQIIILVILLNTCGCVKQNTLVFNEYGERYWQHEKFKIIMDYNWSWKKTDEGEYTFEHDDAEVIARIHVSGPSKDPEGIKLRAQNPDTYSGRIIRFQEKLINGRETYHADVSNFEIISYYKEPKIWMPWDNKSVHFWSKYMIYGDSDSFILITLVSPIEHHQKTRIIMDEFLDGFMFLY